MGLKILRLLQKAPMKTTCFETKYFKGGGHNEFLSLKKKKVLARARSARKDDEVKRLEASLPRALFS